MSVADWTNASTFNKFYKRSKDDRSKWKLVLQSCSKWMRSVFYIFEFCIFSYECTKMTKDDLQLEKGNVLTCRMIGIIQVRLIAPYPSQIFSMSLLLLHVYDGYR